MDDRLRAAYATAMKSSHEGARVQIYMGSDVLEYLRSLADVPDPTVSRTTCGWFDVFPVSGPPDHLSVHTVQTIP